MYSVVLVMALAGSAETPDCHSCHGGMFRGHGCQGACYGGSYSACYGGCYGGGRGSCYGGGCYGGGYGGCYGGCYGGAVMPGGVKPMVEPIGPGKPAKDEPIAAPANIVVTLPAGAKLTIDGYVSTQTSATRILVTPVLQPNQEFVYTLVAETTENGQPVRLSQKVMVRAGVTTPVSFTFGNGVTASR
jgi:uncharacterized protein (TIGR03000 family)